MSFKISLGRTYLVEKGLFKKNLVIYQEKDFTKKKLTTNIEIFSNSILAITQEVTQEDHEEPQKKKANAWQREKNPNLDQLNKKDGPIQNFNFVPSKYLAMRV